MEFLSKRAVDIVSDENSPVEYYFAMKKNRYDPKNNPSGIIDLAVAENYLMSDELVERFNKPDCQKFLNEFMYYGEWNGEQVLREALRDFFRDFIRNCNELNADNFVVVAGETCAFTFLAYGLLDSNECFMCPAPYYSAIDRDVFIYPQSSVVKCSMENDDLTFTFSIEKLNECYSAALKDGKRIKGLIFVNPHNPLGVVYNRETLMSVLNFCAEKQIHAIINETYMNSIFSDDKFDSVLSIADIPDPNRTHFMWTFSKDFCVSGLRCGTIYTTNQNLIQLAKMIGSFTPCPYEIQYKLAVIIRDKEWVRYFFETNKSRLRIRYEKSCSDLEGLGGKVYRGHGGFFILVNLAHVLGISNFEDEIKFVNFAFENGVLFYPGTLVGCRNPGWFRIIFSIKDDIWNEAVSRLKGIISVFKEFRQKRDTK